jgi:hypothetical protein
MKTERVLIFVSGILILANISADSVFGQSKTGTLPAISRNFSLNLRQPPLKWRTDENETPPSITPPIDTHDSEFERLPPEDPKISGDGRKTDPAADSDDDDGKARIVSTAKFHWRAAIRESLVFLGIQHAFRLTQARTQRELGGPFFRDWGRSVKGLRGWRDGDSTFINYVAHPLQGGVTGRIFINNSDNAKKQVFGPSREYWRSRFKAMAWSAIWSTQFELGPISEASLGNVGIRKTHGQNRMGFVDLVVTPTVGTGVVSLEDAVDRYILKNWLERKFGPNSIKIKFFRTALMPTTTFANLLRGKYPWTRETR